MYKMEDMQERRSRSFRGSLQAADSRVSRFGDSMLGLNNGGGSQRIHDQPKCLIISLVFQSAGIQGFLCASKCSATVLHL